jgi:hypothetical protein
LAAAAATTTRTEAAADFSSAACRSSFSSAAAQAVLVRDGSRDQRSQLWRKCAVLILLGVVEMLLPPQITVPCSLEELATGTTKKLK